MTRMKENFILKVKKKEKTVKQKSSTNGFEVIKERPKSQFFDTVKNEMVGSFRPSVKKMTEGEDVSTESAVKNLISDELRNIK